MRLTLLSHPILNSALKRISPIIENKKTASYFTLTISLFTLSFFGLFAVRPTLITAISLLKQVSDLRKLYTEDENKISSLIRGQSEYEKIRNDINLIYASLPTDSEFSKLAKTIEKFAAQENFIINSFQIDPVPISKIGQDGKLYDYGFNLTGTGKYSDLSSFLNHITNWKRIVNISSLEFSQSGNSSTSAILKLSLKATTYYEP